MPNTKKKTMEWSDIQRKVSFISHSTNRPLPAQRTVNSGGPLLSSAFIGFSSCQGGMWKRSALGELLPQERARVETANVLASFFITYPNRNSNPHLCEQEVSFRNKRGKHDSVLCGAGKRSTAFQKGPATQQGRIRRGTERSLISQRKGPPLTLKTQRPALKWCPESEKKKRSNFLSWTNL